MPKKPILTKHHGPSAPEHPVDVLVTCDFSVPNPTVVADPDPVTVDAGGSLRFTCPDGKLVIVAQYKTKAENDPANTPFAGDEFTFSVPMDMPEIIPVKDEPALPPHKRTVEHHYKYALVAVSGEAKIAVADPTIIIRQN